MKRNSTVWRVLPHGPLEKHEPNLWSVAGELPHQGIGRRMVVARSSSGDLLIHSAMALDADSMAQLEGWGRPAILLIPSAWHKMDCAAYLARYPGLKVYCPSGATAAVQKAVVVHGAYEDVPANSTWRLETLRGLQNKEGVVIVTTPGSERVSLVFCDAIFNLPNQPGFIGWLMRVLGSTGGPKVTGLMKLLGVRDELALRAHLQRLAGLPHLERILVAHGDHIENNAQAVLRLVAENI